MDRRSTDSVEPYKNNSDVYACMCDFAWIYAYVHSTLLEHGEITYFYPNNLNTPKISKRQRIT